MKKILYRILSLFCGLLIAEFFLLFFSPIFPLPTDSLINKSGDTVYKMSKEFHHDYRPSQEFIRYPTNLDEFKPIHNRINSLGIRGDEISPKNNYRVILLGDSFLEAEEVEEKTMISNLLNEKFINQFEFIQKGVSSWSPLLELNWLLKVGFSLEPDHIILFLVPNDFYGLSYTRCDASYAKVTRFNNQGDPVAFEVEETDNRSIFSKLLNKLQMYKLLKNLYVSIKGLHKSFHFRVSPDYEQLSQGELDEFLVVPPNKIREILNERLDSNNPIKPQIIEYICLSRPSELWDEKTKDTVDLSIQFLKRIKDHSANRNINLSLVYVPFGWNIDLKECSIARKHYHMENTIIPLGGIEEKIKEFCKNNDTEYLDFFKYIERQGSNHQIYYKSDPHWNPHGHREVANFLERKFSDSNRK